MAIGVVPDRDVELDAQHLESGAPVRGVDWSAFGSAFDMLDGMGSSLIPMCASGAPIAGTDPSDADGLALTFTVWPRYQATHRLWLYSIIPLGTIGVGFKDPSGLVRVQSISDVSLIASIEAIAARSSAEQQLTISWGTTDDATLAAVGCYELVRPSLAVSGLDPLVADAGANVSALVSGYPIADDIAGQGAGFVARDIDALRDSCRRTGLFSIAPYYTTTSASFVPVVQTPPIVLGRCLYNGQTQSMMQFAFSMQLAGGATGEVRITMASGASLTLPAASLIRGQIPIDAEDITTSDGRRSSRDDTVTIEIRRTNGVGTVTLVTGTGGEGAASTSPSSLASSFSLAKRTRFGRGPLPHWMSRKKRTR